MKDEFIHEQFKRVWDDLHGLRQYIKLQFQQESELDKIIINFLCTYDKKYAIEQLKKDFKYLAKKTVKDSYAGRMFPVESIDRYVDMFKTIEENIEKM